MLSNLSEHSPNMEADDESTAGRTPIVDDKGREAIAQALAKMYRDVLSEPPSAELQQLIERLSGR